MPELPEVERARKLIHESCTGYKIAKIQTFEDKIVYCGGTDHESFAKEVEGRTITGCERKGKIFWMTLSGEGRFPIMHFGMTGMIQKLKGSEPTWYRRRPRENPKTWPPRFCKFVMQLEPQEGSVSDQPVELAFLDGRRLGRIRLLPNPVLEHPPLSLLGFDPVLNHPTFEEFEALIKKKKGTVKGMIMDQAFSAGVGNWVADEILYQSKIHPACPVPLLIPQQVKDLHHQIRAVPLRAVEVNADHKKFPEGWLFRWRWSKGKKHERGAAKSPKKVKAVVAGGEEVKVEKIEDGEGDGDGAEDVEEENIKPKGKTCMTLDDGSPATIDFIEVGGRTTAFVVEVQKMPEGVEIKPKSTKGGKGSQKRKTSESDDSGSLTDAKSDPDETPTTPAPQKTAVRARTASAKKVKTEKEDIPSTTANEPSSRQKIAASAAAKIKEELEAKEGGSPVKRRRGRVSTSTSRKRGPGGLGKVGCGQVSLESDSELSDAPEV